MRESYAVWLSRDVVTATGPEAASFLQGQLSQDIEGIRPGGSAWSLVLSPQGKIDALVRVTRAGDEWILDTDEGFGDALLQRLNRFKLRTKVELAPSGLRVLGLRGPGTAGLAFVKPAAVVGAWPGVEGVDVIGDDIAIPEGWPVMDVAASESERIRAGMPAMGAEIDGRTIPAETGAIPVAVSFTKGCYTGQELVARVDSRGNNVPRRLRLLRLPTAFDRGTELLDGAASVGTVTSVAEDPSAGWVGLGYTKRGIDMPARLTAISAAGDRVEVVAEEIPA